MDIQKRFDRILSIFLQLQSKPIVKAKDLADKFDVSLRTIYRDIRSLEEAGVPVFSEAGTGYSLMNSYKLPPTLFTKDEALSFVTAEKLMRTFLDKKLADDFSTALQKMKAVLRTPDKQMVDYADQNVILKRHGENKKYFNTAIPDALNLLLQSVSTHKQIQIFYIKKGDFQAEERIVEPVGLFLNMGYWYFIAYCHLRKDYRQFRLDRLEAIVLTDQDFSIQHKNLAHYLQKEKTIEKIHPITIKVPKTIAPFLSWERDYFGFKSEREQDENIIMDFECPVALQGFVRWFAMFGDHATILEPLTLKAEVIAYLSKQLKIVEEN